MQQQRARRYLQKFGGIAALGHSAALVVGMVLSFTLMFPLLDAAPGQALKFLSNNQTLVYLWIVIVSTDPGAQYDDYFERQDLGQNISFGIWSVDPAVQEQIIILRDSGKIAYLYGTLLRIMPDCNGSQIQVDRIEVQ